MRAPAKRPSKPRLSFALAKVTGIYAAVALMAVGAAHAVAAVQGAGDPRARTAASLAAVVVIAALWLFAIYRITQSHHG